jgi:hypothetical protein
MADNMVERVSRALNAAVQDDDNEMACVIIANRDDILARAAIEAMREPTDAMTEAGDEMADWECNADRIWQAMIDQALKGE